MVSQLSPQNYNATVFLGGQLKRPEERSISMCVCLHVCMCVRTHMYMNVFRERHYDLILLPRSLVLALVKL